MLSRWFSNYQLNWLFLLIGPVALAGPLYSHTVDLRVSGGSMEDVPTYHQGALPLCYSYTAAGMASAFLKNQAFRHSSQKSTLVSPIATAIEASASNYLAGLDFEEPFGFTEGSTSGGNSCATLEYLRQRGSACQQGPLQDLQGQRFFSVMESAYQLYENYHKYQASWKTPSGLRLPPEKVASDYGQYLFIETKKILPELVVQSPGDFYSSLTRGRFIVFAKEVFLPYCQPKGRVSTAGLPACHASFFRQWWKMDLGTWWKWQRPSEAVASKIKHARSLPVTLIICGSALQSEKGYAVGDEATCSRHAILAIGKRKVIASPERYQFLVRNSWGKNCPADYPFECDPKTGDFWVDQSDFDRIVLGINYLE